MRMNQHRDSIVEAFRASIQLSIELCKMVAPIAIGGLMVAIPYILSLLWLANAVGAWLGWELGVATLTLALLLTIVPITLLMAIAIFSVEGWLSENGAGEAN